MTSRPLEQVYAAVVLDAINVKVRDGQVANLPVSAAIGVDLEGHKDILGMWFGDGGGESAKFWMVVLTDRADLSDPLDPQLLQIASRKSWDELSRDLKPISTAVNAQAAAAALDDLDAQWGARYPAIIRLWRNAWQDFETGHTVTRNEKP